eukprot:101406-Amphidinium_carterae.2
MTTLKVKMEEEESPPPWAEDEKTENTAEESRTRVPRTEPALKCAPGFMSQPEFKLPNNHGCWGHEPKPRNRLPNTFATHTEFFVESIRKGPRSKKLKRSMRSRAVKGDVTTMDQEYPYSGVPGFPSLRQGFVTYDSQGNWIPTLLNEPVCVHIQKYSIRGTLSWMMGGMDNLIMLKEQQGYHIKVGFGLDNVEHHFDVEDNVGINERPIDELFYIVLHGRHLLGNDCAKTSAARAEFPAY